MPLPRFDGTLARDVPPYRRIVPFLMRGRNESAVYFEQTLDLGRAEPFLDDFNARHRERGLRATPFHLLLGALPRVMEEWPHLNRFVSGQRLYQRDGVWLSFAAKKRMDRDAPLQVVKQRFEPDEPFETMVARLAGEVTVARSDARSHVDKELDLFLRLPRFVLSPLVRLVRWLDFYNLAPRLLLESDPMYASVFVANLGSVKLGAAYHHLYEWGNCPIFVTVGTVERAALVDDDGQVAVRTVVRLRYSYDERIEDGFYCARALDRLRELIEDPAAWAKA